MGAPGAGRLPSGARSPRRYAPRASDTEFPPVAKKGATYASSEAGHLLLPRGFGLGNLTPTTSWLLYFASIIMTSIGHGMGQPAHHGRGILVAIVNFAGATFTDRVQSLIGLLLLAVFAVFTGCPADQGQ